MNTLLGLDWPQLGLCLVVSFTAVCLKGIQHQNVNAQHKRLVVVFSFLMAAFDAITIGLIVRNGLAAAIPNGIGASLGMLTAFYVHKRLILIYKRLAK